MFDKKPIVVKPWEPNVDDSKENMDRIPVWIRLKGLDIKYLGNNALTKISGLVGKPLKADRATTNKERLAFARVLVEVSINQQYPKQVMFENEVGKIVKQEGEKAIEGPIQNKENKKGENKVSEKGLEKQLNNPATITTRNALEVLNKGGGIEELRLNKASFSCPEGEIVEMGLGRGRGGGTPCLMDKIGFWNVRGLNRLDKQREIHLFMHNSGASLFGLLETKIKRSKAHRASLNLCEGWSFTKKLAHHPKGRIWLLWKPVIFDVDRLRTTDQLIHSAVKHKGTRVTINVTMIYAYNDITPRKNLWKEIEDIYRHTQGPWAVMGDFNNVLNKDEKIGSTVTMAETTEFRQCVNICSLQELKSTGAFYTWNNKQSGEDR
ncbi:PREDICTED: uncharacterized protein LOC109244159 [Nicotiana attenuata]|uniref:uncharacterized protein LOC109244159 n=1 Tax=Nicotiana attenuata TaxID=49451 RepID=UPI0009057222|nr:PREDICTED: uncharacterized protein LOC109244159 [Nicotiana attenuata]